MYLFNKFGRLVEVDDDLALAKLKTGRFRKATPSEIDRYNAGRVVEPVSRDSLYYAAARAAADGYGMSRQHIKKELQELGVQIVETYAQQKVGLTYNYPYSVVNMRTNVRLLYTMFESDKIPEDWYDYLREADEVIVPSQFCADTFRRAGIETTVVPLGYNDNYFRYAERPNRETYTFIHYDSFNMRKGFKEVFDAFTQEFTKDEPVRLILKTVHDNTFLPIMKSEYPNIDVIRGSYSERDLAALLHEADCMVYPSRGEGFGITPLEAMATGLPAIVPNAHGISEYFDPRYMLEAKVSGTCPALIGRFKGQDVGSMVVCDVDSIRKQMRWAFDNQAKARALGAKASEYVKSYTFKQTAAGLKARIDYWESQEVKNRPDDKFLRVEVL